MEPNKKAHNTCEVVVAGGPSELEPKAHNNNGVVAAKPTQLPDDMKFNSYIFPPGKKNDTSGEKKKKASTKKKRDKKSKENTTVKPKKKQKKESDFVAPPTIRKFFKGYGWYSGTVGSVTEHGTFVVKYEDGEEEELRERQLKKLMELEKFAVGEVGYRFLREFEGKFYSGNVKSINDDDTRECYLTDRKYHTYTLDKLNDWKDLKNSDDDKVKL